MIYDINLYALATYRRTKVPYFKFLQCTTQLYENAVVLNIYFHFYYTMGNDASVFFCGFTGLIEFLRHNKSI